MSRWGGWGGDGGVCCMGRVLEGTSARPPPLEGEGAGWPGLAVQEGSSRGEQAGRASSIPTSVLLTNTLTILLPIPCLPCLHLLGTGPTHCMTGGSARRFHVQPARRLSKRLLQGTIEGYWQLWIRSYNYVVLTFVSMLTKSPDPLRHRERVDRLPVGSRCTACLAAPLCLATLLVNSAPQLQSCCTKFLKTVCMWVLLHGSGTSLHPVARDQRDAVVVLTSVDAVVQFGGSHYITCTSLHVPASLVIQFSQ